MCEDIPQDELHNGENIRTLGQGSYGKVVLLKTARYGHLAVKQCNPMCSQIVDVDTLREVDILLRLEGHPNVVQLKGVSNNLYRISLVFEPLTYDLENFIQKHTTQQRLDHLSNLIRSMFSVLATLQSMNIHHFDVKPRNILCALPTDETPKVVFKLADFGAAENKFPQMTYPGLFITRMYRPPEMLAGRDNYDRFKSDIWSLGITLLEFIVGHPVINQYLDEHEVLRFLYEWSNVVEDSDFEFFQDDIRSGESKIRYRFRVSDFLRTHLYTDDHYRVERHEFLLTSMLMFNPKHRISAPELLDGTKPVEFSSPLIPEKERYLSKEEYSTILELTSNARTRLLVFELMSRYPRVRIPHLPFIITRLAERYSEETSSFWGIFDRYLSTIPRDERWMLDDSRTREKVLINPEYGVLAQLGFRLYNPSLIPLIEQVEKIKWTPELVSVFNQDITTWASALIPKGDTPS